MNPELAAEVDALLADQECEASEELIQRALRLLIDPVPGDASRILQLVYAEGFINGRLYELERPQVTAQLAVDLSALMPSSAPGGKVVP